MYFIVEDRRSISMKSSDLGPFFEERLNAQLRLQLEGASSKHHDGLIVHLLGVRSFSKPRIQDGTGMVVVEAQFRSIVFRPFKNEAIDCVVDQLNRTGFYGYFGPMKIFVSRGAMPDDMQYDERTGSFSTLDGSQRISLGVEVRVRIIGVKRDGNNLYAVGSIDGDFLGPSLMASRINMMNLSADDGTSQFPAISF